MFMTPQFAGSPTVSATPSVDSYLPFFPSFGFTWTFGQAERS